MQHVIVLEDFFGLSFIITANYSILKEHYDNRIDYGQENPPFGNGNANSKTGHQNIPPPRFQSAMYSRQAPHSRPGWVSLDELPEGCCLGCFSFEELWPTAS